MQQNHWFHKKLFLIPPRTCLLTIYKAFVRPHQDYANIIYDKPDNKSFKDWLKKIQCNAALAITGAIRGTSQKRIYNELSLESLADRRWYRKMWPSFIRLWRILLLNICKATYYLNVWINTQLDLLRSATDSFTLKNTFI